MQRCGKGTHTQRKGKVVTDQLQAQSQEIQRNWSIFKINQKMKRNAFRTAGTGRIFSYPHNASVVGSMITL